MALHDAPLLADGVEARRPVHVVDEGPVPATGDVVLPWDRFVEALDADVEFSRLGVSLPPTVDVLTLDAALLRQAGRIVLSFPTFADGRAYTQARLLRERVGFAGHIRATGEVLRDQAFYLRRCGFDELEPAPDETVTSLARGWSDFSVTYQPAADERLPLYRRTNRRAAPEVPR